ncbi:MAG: phytase [bacterium]
MLLRRLMLAAVLLVLTARSVFSQSVVVNPVVSTEPTAGNADDPAIWIHPTQPERSVIIGSDKDAGVYVYDMNGHEIQHIEQGTRTNNIDIRYGINLAGEVVDILAANLRAVGKLAVFKINPNYSNGDVLVQIADKNSSNNDIQKDSYGFTLYKRKSDGSLYVFDRPKRGGAVRQYLVQDDGTPNGVVVTPVRDLDYGGGTAEGFCADDELGYVYITEESKGIHKYHADPDLSSARILLFAEGDGTASDREGLALYACSDGTGYLVLSSQGNSTFKVYERQGDNRFVKTIEPKDHKGSGGLGTDGLDVTSYAAPPNFPNGFLVGHDDGAARYHVYDWAAVAESDLTICVNGGEGGGGDGGGTTAISGQVRNSLDNNPVAGATVQLRDGNSVRYETTSNSAGQYSFSTITPGTYELFCRKDGFDDFSTTVSVSEGQTLSDQNINLVPIADTTPPAPPQNVRVSAGD